MSEDGDVEEAFSDDIDEEAFSDVDVDEEHGSSSDLDDGVDADDDSDGLDNATNGDTRDAEGGRDDNDSSLTEWPRPAAAAGVVIFIVMTHVLKLSGRTVAL